MVGPYTAKRGDMYTLANSLCTGSPMDIAREEDQRTHGDETWTMKYRTTG